MKLDDSRRSDNVEDDRGGGGGGIRGIHLGLGGTVILLVVGYFMGISPSTMLSFINGDGQQASTQAPTPATSAGAANDPQVDFVRAILGRDRGCVGRLLQKWARPMFRRSWCCSAGGGVGLRHGELRGGTVLLPGRSARCTSICPFSTAATQFGAPGDFARAYVIAHEVGHHVQNLLGITDKAAAGRAAARAARWARIKCRSKSNCRLIASPASGPRRPIRPGKISSPAIWKAG
jgi:predicted metalloprotease